MAKPRSRNMDMFGDALAERSSDALFGLSTDFPQIVEVDVESIVPNPFQPRQAIDDAGIAELAASLQRHGLLQPIAVQRLDGNRFQLIAGERRWRAARSLGWPTLFAIITTGDPAELALIENIQRQNLNALEEAEAYRRLMDRHGYTQDHLGRIVGRHQTAISHILRLLTLPEEIKAEYATSHEKIAKSVLLEIAALPSPQEQVALWRQAQSQKLTVKAVRAARRPRQSVALSRSHSRLADSLRRTAAELTRLRDDISRTGLTGDERDALAALREEIDALLQAAQS